MTLSEAKKIIKLYFENPDIATDDAVNNFVCSVLDMVEEPAVKKSAPKKSPTERKPGPKKKASDDIKTLARELTDMEV